MQELSSQPHKADKGRRRRQQQQPRNKVVTDSGSAYETTSLDESSDKRPAKQISKKKRQQHTPQESSLSQQIAQASSSRTPPPARIGNDQPAVNVATNGYKGDRNKGALNNENISNSPGPKRSRTQQTNTTTPVKPVIEAYAGPTFHASPAPSTLPVPKFFSRSAPPTDPDVGISARLRQEDGAASSSSEQDPDSPSMRSSARPIMTSNVAGPPALFDMLLNADRQEKERQRASQDSSPMRINDDKNGKARHGHRPQHSRTLTGGTVFPIDLDTSSGRSTPASGPAHPPQQIRQASVAVDKNALHAASGEGEEGNLKRMLFSSPSSKGNSAPGQHGYAAVSHPSPSWVSSPASRPTASPYGTPSPSSSTNGLAACSRPAPASPYMQAPNGHSTRRPQFTPQQNSQNSGLRREVSPGQLNLQNIPQSLGHRGYVENRNFYDIRMTSPLTSPVTQRFAIQSGHQDAPSSQAVYGNQSHVENIIYGPSSKRFSAQDALNASIGRSDAPANATAFTGMENELRKILRLDELRVGGTSAPPN